MKSKSVFIIILLLIASFLVYYFAFKNKGIKEEIINIQKIDKYNYTLDNRDSDYMKEVFEELKVELEKEDVDKENYAKLLAKLFVIDLYTLNNKNSSFDVGSSEYILPESKENFIIDAKASLYKNIELFKQLPTVKNVNIKSVDTKKLSIDGVNKDSYKVTLDWEYEKDYGYDKSGVITFVDIDDILYVVEYVSGDNNEK